MECELKVAQRIVRTCVIHIFIVIYVVNFNLELIIAFKVVLHVDLGDPLGVQVIVNYFCLTDLLP